jgi:hypothetical protein
MARPKTNGTSIFVRLSPEEKDRLGKKLIAVDFIYSRGGNVEAGYSEFMKALADKPLEWFQKNFSKVVDISE